MKSLYSIILVLSVSFASCDNSMSTKKEPLGGTTLTSANDTGVVSHENVGEVTPTNKKSDSGYPKSSSRNVRASKYKPTNKKELVAEIKRAMDEHGSRVDLNYIDTSAIKDMNYLFSSDKDDGYELSAFEGDISKWDVSAVTTMYSMFSGATKFNKDISKWNVSRVTTMGAMFFRATAFNKNISKWNVSAVTNMHAMFWGATAFNKDISKWNVSSVTNMTDMFDDATAFKQNLNAWESRLSATIKKDWSLAKHMFTDSGLADNLPDWCKNTKCKDQQ